MQSPLEVITWTMITHAQKCVNDCNRGPPIAPLLFIPGMCEGHGKSGNFAMDVNRLSTATIWPQFLHGNNGVVRPHFQVVFCGIL